MQSHKQLCSVACTRISCIDHRTTCEHGRIKPLSALCDPFSREVSKELTEMGKTLCENAATQVRKAGS